MTCCHVLLVLSEDEPSTQNCTTYSVDKLTVFKPFAIVSDRSQLVNCMAITYRLSHGTHSQEHTVNVSDFLERCRRAPENQRCDQASNDEVRVMQGNERNWGNMWSNMIVERNSKRIPYPLHSALTQWRWLLVIACKVLSKDEDQMKTRALPGISETARFLLKQNSYTQHFRMLFMATCFIIGWPAHSPILNQEHKA